MEQEKIIERLKTFMEIDCSSASAFAKAAGIDASNFAKMMDGKLNITRQTLKKIADAHAINIVWLISGDGEMLASAEDKGVEKSLLPKPIQTRPRIPYAASAGSLTHCMDGVKEVECEQRAVICAFPEYNFTIFIKGNSMAPKYESGDEVACKRIDNTCFIQWGRVHVLDTAQGIVIKRIYEDKDGIRCVSYNPEYPDFSIPKDEIYSMSLVVGLLRI